MITGSALGLKTIWPGVLIGGVIGGMLGLLFPKIGKTLSAILDFFP
jgi:gas vesicle protein